MEEQNKDIFRYEKFTIHKPYQKGLLQKIYTYGIFPSEKYEVQKIDVNKETSKIMKSK